MSAQRQERARSTRRRKRATGARRRERVMGAGGRIVARAALVVAFVIAAALLYALLAPTLSALPGRRLGDRDFGLAPYRSAVDADADGIDDQTDILASTKAYVETDPAYESDYYEGGYPDDGRGVCTDVVAAGLLGAGYDLRALVDEDIRAAPGSYDVGVPDANIDYRRVRNLRVWFSRHATSLSLDTGDIDAWRGGDIVCWEDHIGIVSDRRNGDGVPYVIHHWGTLQVVFEEDSLADFGEIVGHWRLS